MVTGLTLRVALGIDIACVAVGALAGALVSGSEPLPYRGGVCIEYYQGTFGPTLRVEVSTRFLTGIFAEPFTLVSRFISNAGRQSEPDPASSWHPLEAPAARPPA